MKNWTRAAFAAVMICGLAVAGEDARPVPGNGVIDTPGNYILQGDRRSFSTSRAAIEITANDVTVDLNGTMIAGPGGKTGVGVRILGVSGVQVMNGSFSNLAFGVVVMNSRNVVVKNLRIRAEGLPIVALPPETGIMIVQSRNVVVEDNAIYNVGLGIFVRGSMSTGNRIANNTLTAGTNGVLGICYNPADDDPMGPVGDLVTGNAVSGFSTGIQIKAVAKANVVKGNTIFYRGGTAVDLLSTTSMDLDNTKVMLP